MNIVWIALDTQRADHLHCYGYPHQTSPNLDALADDGVLFENYISCSAHTTPAFTSMFSGQEVFHHGVIATLHASYHEPHMRLNGETITLPEAFYLNGWVPTAFDNLINHRARPGWFARGWRRYINMAAPNQSLSRRVTGCEWVNSELLPWLGQMDTDENNLLFVHYWDPHQPYEPPEPWLGTFDRSLDDLEEIITPDGEAWLLGAGYREALEQDADARESVCRHNEELLRVDNAVGQIVEALRDEGVYDDTMIVVNADHGDDMLEHHSNFEHREVYDHCIRLPLIVKPAANMEPGPEPGTRVEGLVSHADLMPGLLDAANIEWKMGPLGCSYDPLVLDMDGHSFLPMMQGKTDSIRDAVISVGSYMRREDLYRTVEISVRELRHKLIVRAAVPPGNHTSVEVTGMTQRDRRREEGVLFSDLPRAELLDLKEDPTETKNYLAERPQIARRLYDRLLPCLTSHLFYGDPPAFSELLAGL